LSDSSHGLAESKQGAVSDGAHNEHKGVVVAEMKADTSSGGGGGGGGGIVHDEKYLDDELLEDDNEVEVEEEEEEVVKVELPTMSRSLDDTANMLNVNRFGWVGADRYLNSRPWRPRTLPPIQTNE
jgi:hypothetical protein